MKSIIVTIALFVGCSTAFADGNRYRDDHGFNSNHRGGHAQYFSHKPHHNNYNWVAPLVIGGVIGYAITQPRTAVVGQPPIYVERSSPIVTYSVQSSPQYEEKYLYDSSCACYRKAYVEK